MPPLPYEIQVTLHMRQAFAYWMKTKTKTRIKIVPSQTFPFLSTTCLSAKPNDWNIHSFENHGSDTQVTSCHYATWGSLDQRDCRHLWIWRKQNNNHDGSVNHFLCPHCVGICHLNFWVAATAKLVVPVVYLWLLSNKAKTREKVEVGGKPLVWDTKATTGKESGGAEKAEGNPNAVPELRIKS